MDKSIENAKVRFGLVAQGCIPTIETMLDAGYSWKEIGLRINWEPSTAREWYIRYLRNAAKEIEELRDWVRDVLRDRPGATGGLVNHFGSCRKSDTGECTCKTDRIREIVGGGE